jgi:precorrin-6B C5,15-methyltransferase / cobalt-precorrin-6B C5,C15-methyltransferase
VNRISIIGIGYKLLGKKAGEVLLNSEIIVTSGRLVEVFKQYDEYELVSSKLRIINNVDETIRFIRASISTGPIVLLASGDPLFFGIGRRAIEEFGKEAVAIFPELSSVQIAFARIRESWDDALLISLHGGPDPEKRRRLPYEMKDIPMLMERHRKIAILTDKENNPSAIAGYLESLSAAGYSRLKIYVCEKLGYEDEKITEGSPEEIAAITFADPNIVIIQNTAPVARQAGGSAATVKPASEFRFGLTENEISHERGLITKDEIRAVTIHKLRLPEKGVFWDIGAGSGSVSIEAAGLGGGLKIFAVEKESNRVRSIRKNIEKFQAMNIEIIEGTAPDALKELPAPDRVFIGGSSGRMKESMGIISDLMSSGIVVINATTIETLNEAMQALAEHGFASDVAGISVSRSKLVGGRTHLSALNPVFVITGRKGI